jgi:hypothetical protein
MATSPQVQPQLPLFYRNLVPLSSDAHAAFGLKQRDNMAFARDTHAIPVTVDEFALAQRHYPIVFGADDNAVPLALVGLREGENLFVDPDGQWRARAYIPAYLRRHPFMLARLSEDQNVLSLMFDDSWGLVSADGEQKLFEGTEPSEVCKGVLKFCEEFEQAVARTRGFIEEVKKLDLLMDGQASIQNPGMAEPANFSGFKMVDEKKLQNIRGDQARKMVQNGMMGLLYAHLFSLSLMRDLFADLQAAPAA